MHKKTISRTNEWCVLLVTREGYSKRCAIFSWFLRFFALLWMTPVTFSNRLFLGTSMLVAVFHCYGCFADGETPRPNSFLSTSSIPQTAPRSVPHNCTPSLHRINATSSQSSPHLCVTLPPCLLSRPYTPHNAHLKVPLVTSGTLIGSALGECRACFTILMLCWRGLMSQGENRARVRVQVANVVPMIKYQRQCVSYCLDVFLSWTETTLHLVLSLTLTQSLHATTRLT